MYRYSECHQSNWIPPVEELVASATVEEPHERIDCYPDPNVDQ
jgi:hypothetical protein